ncbi:MAG: glucose-6-phosphate isomerase [Acidimicrobiia bacterium]
MSDLWDRLQARDASLWPEGNVSPTRLGWLDIAERMRPQADDLGSWASTIDADKIVLIGMGGSSLGPEVLRAAVGSDRLLVLDTTDPETIESVDATEALFLVSSKSGGTLEVQALLAHFWSQVPDGSRFVAITDPGTALNALATERGFSRIFVNDPDIGGRYSVLSYFGLVPAALLGYDVAALCESAMSRDPGEAVGFGVMIAEAAQQGQDKLTIHVEDRWTTFGLWAEQLIAESTGKQGKGIVPVPVPSPEAGEDRLNVSMSLNDPSELGGEFFAWEVATAIAGHVLGIDPFDEPNVAEAKKAAGEVLSSLPLPEVDVAAPEELGPWLNANVVEGDYVALQAYLPYGNDAALESLRQGVRDLCGGVAVTSGYGPRFLHSTGQLHKGGPDSVVAVQFVPARPTAQVEVPGSGYDFATLIAAQSIGDLRALQSHGRRVLRVQVDEIGDVSL